MQGLQRRDGKVALDASSMGQHGVEKYFRGNYKYSRCGVLKVGHTCPYKRDIAMVEVASQCDLNITRTPQKQTEFEKRARQYQLQRNKDKKKRTASRASSTAGVCDTGVEVTGTDSRINANNSLEDFLASAPSFLTNVPNDGPSSQPASCTNPIDATASVADVEEALHLLSQPPITKSPGQDGSFSGNANVHARSSSPALNKKQKHVKYQFLDQFGSGDAHTASFEEERAALYRSQGRL
jgi:hypothetical protein